MYTIGSIYFVLFRFRENSGRILQSGQYHFAERGTLLHDCQKVLSYLPQTTCVHHNALVAFSSDSLSGAPLSSPTSSIYLINKITYPNMLTQPHNIQLNTISYPSQNMLSNITDKQLLDKENITIVPNTLSPGTFSILRSHRDWDTKPIDENSRRRQNNKSNGTTGGQQSHFQSICKPLGF